MCVDGMESECPFCDNLLDTDRRREPYLVLCATKPFWTEVCAECYDLKAGNEQCLDGNGHGRCGMCWCTKEDSQWESRQTCCVCKRVAWVCYDCQRHNQHIDCEAFHSIECDRLCAICCTLARTARLLHASNAMYALYAAAKARKLHRLLPKDIWKLITRMITTKAFCTTAWDRITADEPQKHLGQ